MTTPLTATAALDEHCDVPARPTGLRLILGAWADKNSAFINAIEKRVSQSPTPLSETALWDLIAAQWSADWRDARKSLGVAAADYAERMKPENIPLGAIGMALDAGALGQSEKKYQDALADFTVINETLRQDEYLSRVLHVLSDTNTTLDASLALSKQAQRLHAKFSVVATAPAPKAEKKGFRAYVDMIFGSARKQSSTATVTVTPTAIQPQTLKA